MSVFGHNSIGASNAELGKEKITLLLASKPATGKIKKLFVYVSKGGTAGTAKLKAVIYAKSGSEAGAKLAEGTEVTCTDVEAGAGKWLELPIPAEPEEAIGEYWIGFSLLGTEHALKFYFDEPGGNLNAFRSYAGGALPANFAEAPGETLGPKQLSVYAEYTASAVTVTKPSTQVSGKNIAAQLQVVATGTTEYKATGLPEGMSINAASGLITGTPKKVQTVTVTLKVKGEAGEAETTFTWEILNVFGKTSIGASNGNYASERERVTKITAPQSGEITALRVYMAPTGNVGTQKFKALIYAVSGGAITTLLGTSEEVALTNGFAAGWVTFTFAAPVSFTSGTLALGTMSGGTENIAEFFFDEAATNVRFSKNHTYSEAAANPFGEANSEDNKEVSIYALFNPAATGVTKPAAQTNTVNIPINEFHVQANNVTSYAATSLPTGLTIDTATGIITGTPTKTEAPTVTIKVTGPETSAETTFTWNIVTAATAKTWRGYTPFSPIPVSAGIGAATNPFNSLVGQSRVLPNSAEMVAWLLSTVTGFGPGEHSRNGFPRVHASDSDPQVELIQRPGESSMFFDKKKVRIPTAAKLQPIADKHLEIVLCPSDCALHGVPEGTTAELWQVEGSGETVTYEGGGTKLKCSVAGKSNLTSDLKADGGATASNMNMSAGVVRGPELKAGAINHALIFTAKNCKNAHVYPANHSDGEENGLPTGLPSYAPAMGQRFILEMSDAEIEALSIKPWLKAVLKACAKYGFYLCDTGNETINFRLEAGQMYSAFGATDLMNRVGEEQGLAADAEGYKFLFGDPAVPWSTKMRAVAPPATEGSTPSLTKPADQVSGPSGFTTELHVASFGIEHFEATGLPSGMTINSTTGVIQGILSVPAVSTVTIIGKGSGTELAVSFKWTVVEKTTPKPEPPPGPTPMPAVSELGLMLYDAMAPLAKDDRDNDWSLLTYCDALMAQAQPLRDQVKEVGNRAGYGVLMDPDQCPANGLIYLAECAGVDLDRMQKSIVVIGRNEEVNPSFEYDAAGGSPFAFIEYNEGCTKEDYKVSETWASLGKKSLHMKAKKDNTTTNHGFGFVQDISSSSHLVPIAVNQWLAVQMVTNIIAAGDQGFTLKIEWIKSDGLTIIGTSESVGLLKGLTGVQTLNANFKAPTKAAFARISVLMRSKTALQTIDYYVDQIVAQVTSALQSLPIEYIGGDQPESSWVGAPGKSPSIKYRQMTEEEFVNLQREWIKALPASERGTVSGLTNTIKQYLIGSKTVIVKERPEGKAWRIKIATFLQETPSEKIIKRVIEEFMPAGIVFEYEMVPSVSYFLIATEFASYTEVGSVFLTYAGLGLNHPGT